MKVCAPRSRHLRRPLCELAVVFAATLAFAACAARVAAQTPPTLYSEDAAVRAAASAELRAAGAGAVPSLDPSASGCLDAESRPEKCGAYDLALAEIVSLLETIARQDAARNPGGASAAKDLLWRMLHDPSADPFDLGLDPRWDARTDGKALRDRASALLVEIMALPKTLPEAQASARAVARSRSDTRHWYLLANCAGATMLTGCSYGLYLYDAAGVLLGSRFIRADAPESVGAGVETKLSIDTPIPGLGQLRATGGFGGDVERAVIYRLEVALAPLCALASGQEPLGPASEISRWVDCSLESCSPRKLGAAVRFTDLKREH